MLSELRADDPTEVGPFRLEARLGSGEMGDVFLGRSAGGRPVAVKVVSAPLAADAPFRRQFAREVAAARRVDGLYTARVVDARTDGEHPWVATAYIPGPTLREAVAEGPLPAAAVGRLATGLLEGLASIHGAQVVHRNLTPDNVILAADGPRVIDFGLARALEHTSTATIVSDPGTDTVAFMSPEQVLGGAVTPASDVFSLGCVLHFAAVGSSPFGGGTPEDTMSQILHGEPDLSRLPSALARPVASCLERDPGARPSVSTLLNRFTSDDPASDQWLPEAVSEMVTELAAATEPQEAAATPAAAPAPQPVPTAERWRPSRRLVLGAVAAVAAIGLVIGGVATLTALTGDDAPPEYAQGGDGGGGGASGDDGGSAELHTIVLEAFYENSDAEGLPLGVTYTGFHDSNTYAFSNQDPDASEVELVEVQPPWSETIEFEGPLDSFTLGVMSGQPITSELGFTCRVTLDGEVLVEATDSISMATCDAHYLRDDDDLPTMLLSSGDTCKGALIRNPPSCDD
ncbi:serine/threonine protein kinase [Promicromonospora sp. AC04]|uniref:serine/threonine-protein kinase n=1 Tax=Promicromonospora sp. AC04 TaxID=2135723 RepID=UPI000D355172|nr:serine/threonine-protein kinase [Promicromonospora sp. AC04]PUB25381.1 serine/threonine protein kinase [Promicromonospora sp. AC04]